MEISINKDSKSASLKAAKLVAELISKKPDAVLGLATGGTPLELYDELVRMHKNDGLDFSKVKSFNLDEYLGLPASDPASYRRFMDENFFDKINIDKANTFIPDGLAKDARAHCAEYEEKIRAMGGIDLQVLGIGADGHIGFNEPLSSFSSRTGVRVLAPETLKDNARFFGGDENKVPRLAISMGVGTIMDARKIVLLAFGKSKSEAVEGMIEGPVSAFIVASILQFHESAHVFIDEDAAYRLTRKDYYKWVENANVF